MNGPLPPSPETLVELVLQVARVPSFSSHEGCLHAVIERLLADCPGVEFERIPDHNLVVRLPGCAGSQPVALAAHLDKINHYPDGLQELPASERNGKLVGAMDDAAGVGLCLALARLSTWARFPPLWLLFSEMEESYGLNHHPHRLRQGGQGLEAGLGAIRIARALSGRGERPAAVIVLDTTPLFRGQPGCALYCAPWERAPVPVTDSLRQATHDLRTQLLALDPGLRIANNDNDYLDYAVHFNTETPSPVPCVALEPSIGPYHQRDEEVFVDDLRRIESLLTRWLTQVGDRAQQPGVSV